jgi:hypothetical protein
MTPKLAHFLNKTILLCIPSLYDDKQPRPYTLVGIEPCGVWLESEDLASTLLTSEKRRPPPTTLAAFVPFAQIAYVLDGTHILTPAQKASVLAQQKELSRQRGEEETDADKPKPIGNPETRSKPNRGKKR